MSTAQMARSAFSTAAFAQLVRRLRHTNARYNQIALQFRCRARPTYHAKRRAFRVGLSIDTSKARSCSNRVVHKLPAPVLDLAPVETDTDTETTGDAYMRNLPEVVMRKRRRRRDGRQRIMLRLPPLKVNCPPSQGPIPGAPRLLPRQLPEDDYGVEDIILSSSSSTDSNTPRYSGLCITIPPRSLKRKLQDFEADNEPNRSLRARSE